MSYATRTDDSRPTVILVHGFAAHRRWMSRLERHFQQAGRRTVNWGYNSWFRSIEEHAQALARDMAQWDEDPQVKCLDFVTHSMGCIVTRAALLTYRPRKCGRWVMLAPPNGGSRMADRLSPLLGWLMKPLHELRASDDSYVNNLAVPEDLEFAVVAATLDYIVGRQSTMIPQEKDRYVVKALHSSMLFRQEVAEQCLQFLHAGSFQKERGDAP